jgi:putative ABC transport system permease protein
VINIILYHYTGIESLQAVLEPTPAIILVIISMVLTFVAGLFPSKTASNKDPVIALRTE